MSLGGAGGHIIYYHLQTLEVNLSQNMSTAVWVPLASYPGPLKNRRKGPGIYCLRMRLISRHSGIPDNTVIPPCAVMLLVHCRIFIRTLLTMVICMQDDSAVLYVLLRLRGEAKALKLERKHL